MTVVNFTGLETVIGSPVPIEAGLVTAQYWAGRGPYVRITDDKVVFPTRIDLTIVDGVPERNLELEPTGDECCVRLQITYKAVTVDLFVAIPDQVTVDIGDLVVVDPRTFQPTADANTVQTVHTLLLDGLRLRRITQAEYDAIPTPRPTDVLFVITQ